MREWMMIDWPFNNLDRLILSGLLVYLIWRK